MKVEIKTAEEILKIEEILKFLQAENFAALRSLKGDVGRLDMNIDPMQIQSFIRGKNAAYCVTIDRISNFLSQLKPKAEEQTDAIAIQGLIKKYEDELQSLDTLYENSEPYQSIIAALKSLQNNKAEDQRLQWVKDLQEAVVELEEKEKTYPRMWTRDVIALVKRIEQKIKTQEENPTQQPTKKED